MLGPFEVLSQVGRSSFVLRLPAHFRSVHPVFHVAMLEPEKPSNIPNHVQLPPAPVVIDGEPEFEISEILDSKIDKRRHPCQLLYLVQWTGYEGTDKETSWILATELPHALRISMPRIRTNPDLTPDLTDSTPDLAHASANLQNT